MTDDSGFSASEDPSQYPTPPVPPAAPVPPSAPVPPAAGYVPPAASTPGAKPLGFDQANLKNFDPKSVNPMDWGVIACGLLIFIFSLFGYYKYSVKGVGDFGGASATWSAWHGFFGWFAALVALAAAAVLAAALIAKIVLPFPVRLVVLGAFALATLCVLLALIVVPGPSSSFIDKGHGFAYWISLILVLVGTGLSYVRFSQLGGKLPGRS